MIEFMNSHWRKINYEWMNRDVEITVANHLVDKSGLGVKKLRKKRGAALFPWKLYNKKIRFKWWWRYPKLENQCMMAMIPRLMSPVHIHTK